MIGVFDSGIGGFDFVNRLKKKELFNIYYFADYENFPYGNKSHEEVLNCMQNAFQIMEMQGCSVIVIACNTASFVYEAQKLQQTKLSNIPIINMLPFLKKYSDFSNVLYISTALSAKFAANDSILKNNNFLALPMLANFIENQDFDEIKLYLKNFVLNKNVVYACTHYPFAEDVFKNIFPDSLFFNPVNDLINFMIANFDLSANNFLKFNSDIFFHKYKKFAKC